MCPCFCLHRNSSLKHNFLLWKSSVWKYPRRKLFCQLFLLMYYRAHLDKKKSKTSNVLFSSIAQRNGCAPGSQAFQTWSCGAVIMTKNIHSSEHNVGVSYQALKSHALRVWSQANYWQWLSFQFLRQYQLWSLWCPPVSFSAAEQNNC